MKSKKNGRADQGLEDGDGAGIQNPKTELYRCLLEELRRGNPQKRIAEDARVATKTVNEVYRRIFAIDPAPANAEPRKLQGYAEALTRLAVYFKLDVAETLASYGIEITDAVEVAVRRARAQTGAPRLLADPILSAITASASGDSEGTVKIGLATSPQFHSWDQQGKSFAHQYMARLIGSVNPMLAQESYTVETIPDCIDALMGKQPRAHVLFGLYDTPSRQFLELGFLHLRGIRLPLGAVSTAPLHTTWRKIMGLDEKARPLAIVQKPEAGHLFLKGACRYRADDLVVLDKDLPIAEIALRFVREAASLRRTREVIFASERMQCQQVLTAIRERAWEKVAALSGHDGRELATAALDAIGLVGAETQGHDLDEFTPRYKVGIAVRGDATQWLRLLRLAQEQEIYGNAALLTAELYAELFVVKGKDMIWDDSDLQGQKAERFKDYIVVFAKKALAANVSAHPSPATLQAAFPFDFPFKTRDAGGL